MPPEHFSPKAFPIPPVSVTAFLDAVRSVVEIPAVSEEEFRRSLKAPDGVYFLDIDGLDPGRSGEIVVSLERVFDERLRPLGIYGGAVAEQTNPGNIRVILENFGPIEP